MMMVGFGGLAEILVQIYIYWQGGKRLHENRFSYNGMHGRFFMQYCDMQALMIEILQILLCTVSLV